MRKTVLSLVVAVLVAAIACAVPSAVPVPLPRAFAGLRPGMSVLLRDVGSGYEISRFDEPAVLSHTITELGHDYLALEDVTRVTEYRVPLYAVKAVIVTRIKSPPQLTLPELAPPPSGTAQPKPARP